MAACAVDIGDYGELEEFLARSSASVCITRRTRSRDRATCERCAQVQQGFSSSALFLNIELDQARAQAFFALISMDDIPSAPPKIDITPAPPQVATAPRPGFLDIRAHKTRRSAQAFWRRRDSRGDRCYTKPLQRKQLQNKDAAVPFRCLPCANTTQIVAANEQEPPKYKAVGDLGSRPV